MSKCPCGSKLDYTQCCGLYHHENIIPKAPEQLMRSRYSAYTMANIDYIKKTMHGKPLEQFDELDATTWAKSIKWLKLKIIKTHNISTTQGTVEFIASFIENGQHRLMHEISVFELIHDRWVYVDSTHADKN